MILLLPCYSLEDFSIYRTARESNQIFAAWSALYHPALIHFFGKIPSWDRAGNPAPDKDRRLIVIPPCCESQIPHDWLKGVEESDAVLIRKKETREEIAAAALKGLHLTNSSFPADDAETFFSLGFCHFVSELFSRKLRYMSNLETQKFEEKTVAAVNALHEGDGKSFIENVRRSFEILTESKEYFFPTAMKLLDLTWLDRPSLSKNLTEMLRRRAVRNESTNLVLPTFYLDLLRQENPEGFDLLKDEIRIGRVVLIGGDRDESPLYLLPTMEIASRLIEGWIHYHDAFGTRPAVFGRNGAGYSPVLPQLLHLTGCENALLFTRDGWRPNKEGQSRIHWRGNHRTSIETLARNPQPASDAKTFMELPDRIGYSAGSDRVLSAVFDHLPGRELVWLGDIFRMNRFAPVLGEAPDLASYFKGTKRIGVSKDYGKDEFRTNFLTRAGRDHRPNPVSSWSKFYQLQAKMNSLSALTLFAGLISSHRKIERLSGFEALSKDAAVLDELKSELTDLLFYPTSLALDGTDEADGEKERLMGEIEASQSVQAERIGENWEKSEELFSKKLDASFARLLYNELASGERRSGNSDDVARKTDSAERGVFLANPTPFSAKTVLDAAIVTSPATAPFVTNQSVEGFRRTVVQLPPFSAVWLESNPLVEADPVRQALKAPKQTPRAKKRFLGRWMDRIRGESSATERGKMVELRKERFGDGRAESFYVVRNRYFEIKIDADSGEIRSVRTFMSPTMNANRGLLSQPGMGNRVAWQIAMKLSEEEKKSDHRPENSGHYGYSIMAADQVEILSDGPFAADLRISGSLFAPDGEKLAVFEEILSIGRESRIIDVELTLNPTRLPTAGPWDHYFGVRFAWNDHLADLRVGCHGTLWETDRDYLQGPELIDIRSEEGIGVTILSDGLPFYRRYGLKMMDMILIPKGESQRTFRFGIGLDFVDPLLEGGRFLSPKPLVLRDVSKPSESFVRFLDVTPDSVAVVLLEPLYDSPEDSTSASPSNDSPTNASPTNASPTNASPSKEGPLKERPEENEDHFSDVSAASDESAEIHSPLIGYRLVLQETAGKKRNAVVRTKGAVASVIQTDLLRRKTADVALVDSHSFGVELTPGQILPLEIVIDR